MAIDLENTERLLDDVSWEILSELQKDARISFSELGRRVGLSAPAVAERVRRMEDAGIIQGYHAVIDPCKVGAGMIVVMSIRTDPNTSGHVRQLVIDTPEVLTCHKVTGIECYYMKVIAVSVGHLDRIIESFSRYGHVTTSLVLDSPVQSRSITQSTLPDH